MDIQQHGFDFVEVVEAARVDAPGTWLEPCFTKEEFAGLIDGASQLLKSLPESLACLVRLGIESSREELQDTLARCALADGEAFQLRTAAFDVCEQQCDAFLSAFSGAELPQDWEVCSRERYGRAAHGMHIPGVGSLILRGSGQQRVTLEFAPYRDLHFVGRCRDGAARHELPASTWRPAYCADKLAYGGSGVASVPTFLHQGRQYINDGGLSSGDYAECEGWTFRLRSEWHGETFSYQTQCQAWNEGRLERGDRRGLIVSVRGRQCVLDGVAIFFDRSGRLRADAIEEEAELSGEADEADEAEDELEDLADAASS